MRIQQLDYLKCIFITLMVIFHLVYIGDSYPYAKQVVYTFHMSAFLVISGYLMNIRKSPKMFVRDILWIFVPYVIMELGYVWMSSVLPVREQVGDLSVQLLLTKVCLHPLGPYWYLHTLILCGVLYKVVYQVGARLSDSTRLIGLGIIYFAIAYFGGWMSFANAMYFLAGVAIRQSGQNFVKAFMPSLLSLIPLVLLCLFPANLNRATPGGVAITYLTISLALACYRFLPDSIRKGSEFIGRNTLPIFLFSPIFTMLSRWYLPLFSFDTTGLCFMCVTVVIVIAGSFGIAYLADQGIRMFVHTEKRLFQK